MVKFMQGLIGAMLGYLVGGWVSKKADVIVSTVKSWYNQGEIRIKIPHPEKEANSNSDSEEE